MQVLLFINKENKSQNRAFLMPWHDSCRRRALVCWTGWCPKQISCGICPTWNPPASSEQVNHLVNTEGSKCWVSREQHSAVLTEWGHSGRNLWSAFQPGVPRQGHGCWSLDLRKGRSGRVLLGPLGQWAGFLWEASPHPIHWIKIHPHPLFYSTFNKCFQTFQKAFTVWV